MRITLFALTSIATAAALPAAHAQDAADLDQRLRIIERKLELQQEDAENKARDATIASAGEKGFTLKTAKGDFELKLRALLQADARFFLDDERAFNDTFILRRLRPTFEGSLGKLLGFRLTPEFAGDSATVVDAYIDLKFHPTASVRIGKVKGPIGLERLQSGGATTFVERGFPTELAPNRDLGVQLQGDIAGGAFSYVLGWYNGTADGRDAATRDVDNRKELALRLFAEPFKSDPGFFQNLGFGIAGSTGSKFGAVTGQGGHLPQYRSPGQNSIFSYIAPNATATPPVAGVSANGTHARISPQLYFYRNAFGLLAEYITSEQELLRSGTTADIENSAWQVGTSFVVTGEDASYRGVKPAAPFTLGAPGWGALELAARYGVLEIDDAAFGTAATPAYANRHQSVSEAKAFGLGINWHLTSNAKVALNYDQTDYTDGAGTAAAVTDRKEEKAVFARVQLSY